ncbi:MAG: B12-binding domain-containing radical SAM protein [Clostridia bacterium]|nr:B12-binding domain-containing radical SAM protein [Clostridia bacterium]
MKVLLIMPYHTDLIHAVSLPLGILSIASYLERFGYDVKLVDFSVRRESAKKVYEDFRPDIVGLSFPSVKAIDGIVRISKVFKKNNVPVVWGGSFIDVGEIKHFFDTGLVDVLSFCEGEATWLDLLRTLESGGDLADVKGIAYKKDGDIVVTPPREFMDPMELPRLDFGLLKGLPDYFTYLYGSSHVLYVYLSKGCPARCTFCVNPLCHRSIRRRRSLDDFISELTELITKYDANGFYFGDELAFPNDKELYEVCDAFDGMGLDFNWGFQTRIGSLSEAALKRAYDSGCRWIDYGVESGSREILREVKKGIPYDRIVPDFAVCSRVGLISIANFIIGFPGESEDQVKESINLAKSLESTQNTFTRYIFGSKTEAGRELIRKGADVPQFNKLNDYKAMDFFKNRQQLSHIPQKDLDVIQAFFLMSAIFRKDYHESRSYDLFIKSILTVAKRLPRMGFVCAVKALYEISTDFARMGFDLVLHPGIRKKYGLSADGTEEKKG